MKHLLAMLVSLSFLVTQSGVTFADVVTTIGDVVGTNTALSVKMSGAGTKSGALAGSNFNRYTDNAGSFTMLHGRLFGSHNIGDYIAPTGSSDRGQLLSVPITIHNLTDSTSATLTHIVFDHDLGGAAGDIDDWFLLFDTSTASDFLVDGDEFSIPEQTSSILLQGGANASDLVLGTFGPKTDTLGGGFSHTLIFQESSAVPEPATFGCVAMIGAVFLARRRRKNGDV